MAGDGGRVPDVSERVRVIGSVHDWLAEHFPDAAEPFKTWAVGMSVPDVSEQRQRASIAWCGQCGNVSVDGINFTRVAGGLQCAGCGAVSPHFEYLRRSFSDPASVLAALLAESPEATVAAIEALLTSDEAIGRVARRIRQDSADTYDWRRVARWAMESACRSLLSKAPREDGDA